MAKIQAVALTWFREEDWPRWLEIDPDFQPDYQHWLGRMDEMIASKLAPAGVRLVKITVEPDEFLRWSAEHRAGAIDTFSRSAFAAWKAMQQDRH